ncbi:MULTISPECIES: hypothetical protein [unclassified Streptomyces]|uniref:hypothetical protein n=1 Tax=unclassified Streptomyces TaxID=2593676 RepID=UPI002E1603B8|nr:hypothetical protein OG384_11285 [Streptomyces sp. NBC_01324]
MADLTPTWDFPGIRIGKHSQRADSFADFVCRCGESGQATGDDNVKALVADYSANHGPAHRKEGRRR